MLEQFVEGFYTYILTEGWSSRTSYTSVYWKGYIKFLVHGAHKYEAVFFFIAHSVN